MYDSIDPKEAQFLIWAARDFLQKVDESETWMHKRNRLAIQGYPLVDTEDEVNLLVRTIRKTAYPSRSGGIV